MHAQGSMNLIINSRLAPRHAPTLSQRPFESILSSTMNLISRFVKVSLVLPMGP